MKIKIGTYKHYKGKLYKVLGTGRHSENPDEIFVVYQALYESEFGKDQIWIRPIKMFTEEIDFEGKKVKRFEFLSN